MNRQPASKPVITAKEREVLELYGRMSQRAIAQALGISRSAVRERLENAFRKLVDGAEN